MLPKMILSGIVGVAFITVGTVDMSQAKGGNGPASSTKVRAKLRPTLNNMVVDAEGHAIRFTFSLGNKMRDRFEARVEVPVDTAVVTAEDLIDNQFTFTLNNGSDYATCMMDFEEIDELKGVAEWKLSIRQRGIGTIQNRAGNCVTPIAPNSEPILPNVVADDTAMVMGAVPSGSVELTGTFMPIGGGKDVGNGAIPRN